MAILLAALAGGGCGSGGGKSSQQPKPNPKQSAKPVAQNPARPNPARPNPVTRPGGSGNAAPNPADHGEWRVVGEEPSPPGGEDPPVLIDTEPAPGNDNGGGSDDATDIFGIPKHNAAARPAPRLRAPRRKFDPATLANYGIREIRGKHLVLYTDLPRSKEIDSLPTVFDAAVPQWLAFFQVEPARAKDWVVNVFFMKDRQLFIRTGLLPARVQKQRPFKVGLQIDYDLWVTDQTTPYMRRHLLLHEGTHAFMDLVVGNLGPIWLAEGMAEMLATHQWKDGRLTLNYFPTDKTETPDWGRVRMIRDDYAAGRAKRIEQVFAITGPQTYQDNNAYGWCWAACAFFDRHPAYRDRFRKLVREVGEGDFSTKLRKAFAADGVQIAEQWILFVAQLDYGMDIPRWAVTYAPGKPISGGQATAQIAADRGWQSTGIRLEAGKTYRITASGRYQVARTTRPWMSEPGGVTIRYHGGLPLGVLLAAVRSDTQPFDSQTGLSPLVASPVVVGLGREITPQASGTLYARVNDSPAELSDNAGSVQIQVVEAGR